MVPSYLENLNAAQAEAVRTIHGPLMVLAGPGSGKTRVITCRIAHMIQQGIEPSRIVALTFTNKAAQEMRGRLEQLVGPSDVWLGTFHGFCVRLLRRYARLVGLSENFSIYDVDDSQSALKAAIRRANFELTHVSLSKLANRISFYKNRLITPEILEGESLSSDEYQVSQVYPYYQRELLSSGAVDFDDILMHVATILRTSPELRAQLDARFQYMLVDEYQDTNLAQYVIVRHLCVDHPNLAATGDPDQSIYGWRGASIKNVSNLERDYPELQTVRLEMNYRSTPEVLSTADCLIQYNTYRKQKTLIPQRDGGEKVRLAVYPTARREAEDVADQIAILSERGQFELRDFGILYRTNAHSRLIEQALLRRQIPYQLVGGFRFYLRKEIKDLISYLQLVYNPDDDVALRRAINTPARGIGKKSIEQVQEHADSTGKPLLEAFREAAQFGLVNARAAKAIGKFLKIYDQISSIIHGPLLDLLNVTVQLTGYREYLEKQGEPEEGGNDAVANLDELLAEAAELDAEAADDKPAIEAFLEFAALQADSDKFNAGADCVTLMTLHAAKGLEFGAVYVLAVEENILPHSRSKDDPMEIEEERRLLFVGITRAKERLQLSYAKRRGFSGQGSGVPSSFLLELPRDEMTLVDETEASSDYYEGTGDQEYFDTSKVSWDDEICQVSEGEYDQSEPMFDDACQLSEEEMAARAQSKKLVPRIPGVIPASVLVDPANDDQAQWEQFQPGSEVVHPTFGQGSIVSSSGHGKKRSVSISFSADGSLRTFRLSHVELTLASG
ncbi:MAG TPA: AAA family ATPase [Planctomycetaceae bacterium]|nr:AAA family ATPase [Planctomycetaceae bacterium]